jgi:hypothetical protein
LGRKDLAELIFLFFVKITHEMAKKAVDKNSLVAQKFRILYEFF